VAKAIQSTIDSGGPNAELLAPLEKELLQIRRYLRQQASLHAPAQFPADPDDRSTVAESTALQAAEEVESAIELVISARLGVGR